MHIKTGILLLILIQSLAAFGQSKIVSPNELKFIEDRVQQELNSKDLNNKQKFFINLLAARELYQYRFFEKAESYYRAAIKIDTNENKSEAYINLITISILNKNQKAITDNLKSTRIYFEANKPFATKDIEYYLSSIENQKNDINTVGFYGTFASEGNLKNLIISKDYQKAFSLINPEGVKKAQSSINITSYDTLNVRLNKKNVKELYCNKEYLEFPDAYAYSTLICGLLNDYLKLGKFSANKLKRAENYFTKDDQDKKYLFDMVKEIK